MKIEVKRMPTIKGTTIGKLYVDGMFECFTLEDEVRPEGVKVYGNTAIPAGTYDVEVTYSNRFKRDLPLLKNVPGFEGVRIHPGNSKENTEGCILTGIRVRGDQQWVFESRIAFGVLFEKIKACKEPVTITVS